MNPVQVTRSAIAAQANFMPVLILHESDGEDAYSTSFYEETDGSIVESPVKPERYSESITMISPGKLKQIITNQQAQVLFQINCTEQQILENSPSKNSCVDKSFLELLR